MLRGEEVYRSGSVGWNVLFGYSIVIRGSSCFVCYYIKVSTGGERVWTYGIEEVCLVVYIYLLHSWWYETSSTCLAFMDSIFISIELTYFTVQGRHSKFLIANCVASIQIYCVHQHQHKRMWMMNRTSLPKMVLGYRPRLLDQISIVIAVVPNTIGKVSSPLWARVCD